MGNSDLFTCITWNIDMSGIYSQFQAIIKSVLSKKPDVIFFQEVTDTSLKFMKLELEPKGYSIIEGKKVDYYFIVTAIKEDTTRCTGIKIVDFPRSQMRRYLLITEINWNGQTLHLINAHLESTREGSLERKRQLVKTFRVMEILEETAPVIFAGDTNLRDLELESAGGLPENIKDVWEELQRPKNCEYTWSTRRTKDKWPFKHTNLRFDRVLFMTRLHGRMSPQNISPLGEEKLEDGHYPSDHIGLFVSFLMRR